MEKAAAIAFALMMTSTTGAALARNPHSGGGAPGSSAPNYIVFGFDGLGVATGSGNPPGQAEASIKAKTVNGKRQNFIHLEAQGKASGHGFPVAYSGAALNTPTRVRTPFTFQLLGGDALQVIVNYQSANGNVYMIFSTPTSKLPTQYNKLTDLGNHLYGIPVGSEVGQVPSNAIIKSVSFQTDAVDNCHVYDSDINNLTMGTIGSQIVITTTAGYGESCD